MSESVDLSTTVAGLRLPNPVMVASGCGGTGRELEPFLDVAGLGAFVTRSVTLDARAGARPPRLVETPSGLLHDTGLQGAGLDGFLSIELPWLAQHRARTVVSLAADSLAAYAEIARRLGTSPGVAAVEVNLGWPAGSVAGRSGYQAAKILAVVRRELPSGVPVLAKLDADVHTVVDVARAAVEAGADAVVLARGLPGMVIDPATLRPALDPTTGNLGGPAVHPVALRCVWEVHRALPDTPVVGVGGVRSGFDALQMLLAGACSVQVGSTLLHDPSAPRRIVDELAHELSSRAVPSVAGVVGRAHRPEGDLL